LLRRNILSQTPITGEPEMNVAPEQFTAANKAAAEGMIAVANAQFTMFENLAGLNFKAAKSTYEDLINYIRAASSAKDPQELFTLNAAAVQPALEKMQAHARETYELVAQSQAQLTSLIQAQKPDMAKGFSSFLDQYSQAAPKGSGAAMEAFKSFLATANSAFDSYSKVAKQTTDVAAATSSAAKESHKKTA
jgi:phasin family protein